MSKYCEQCGTELEDNMKFCPKCGTSCDVSTVVSENAEESKKNKLLFEKKRKKRVVFSICGILFMLAVLSGVGGSDENSENKKSVQQLTLEEFIEKDNEIYGEGIRVEDLITNNEGDYILGKDFIDEFVDSGNYTYYYYDNGVAKDRNNQEEVNLALAVQASGKQRNFEILVEESGKIKAIQSSFKDGDFAKAQNLMKIFVPTSEMEDYPKLKDKARKNAIAYDYRDGVVIEVTKNFIRLWYDTVENYEIYSKQQLLSEEEERGIIGETLGVWEQEERWDLPILDITMPSDDKLLIKQYYSEGVDEYGNELFSQKECEVNISDKEYADFSKNIEYKITNQKNEEVILQLVLTQERTIKYTLPQEKSLECIKYLYDEREVAYKKTNKEMFDTTGAQEADFSAEQGSIEGDFSEEFQIENDEPYIFPQSNYEFVEQSELWEYSKEEIVLARNEIFARHGRIFNNENIRQYFESKDWYCGTIDPEEFDNNMDSILNEYEKANIETFKFVEEIKNQRGNP